MHKHITLNLKASQEQSATLEKMKPAHLKFPRNEGRRGIALLFSIKAHQSEKQTNTRTHCLSLTATIKNYSLHDIFSLTGTRILFRPSGCLSLTKTKPLLWLLFLLSLHKMFPGSKKCFMLSTFRALQVCDPLLSVSVLI